MRTSEETLFDDTISRLSFELKLAEQFGRDTITRTCMPATNLNRYYNGRYQVGGWMNDRGWIYVQETV